MKKTFYLLFIFLISFLITFVIKTIQPQFNFEFDLKNCGGSIEGGLIFLLVCKLLPSILHKGTTACFSETYNKTEVQTQRPKKSTSSSEGLYVRDCVLEMVYRPLESSCSISPKQYPSSSFHLQRSRISCRQGTNVWSLDSLILIYERWHSKKKRLYLTYI